MVKVTIRKPAGTKAMLSELSKLGLEVYPKGTTGSEFAIDPYHPPNAKVFRELAGNPPSPKGAHYFIAKKDGETNFILPHAFKKVARENVLAALRSKKLEQIMHEHGFEIFIPKHEVFIKRL